MNKTVASAALAGAILLGGAGAALIPSIVAAADPAPSAAATTTPDGTTDPGAAEQGAAQCAPGAAGGPGGRMGQGGPAGPAGRMHHLQVAADAIGIAESDLATQLRDGASIADVADASGVDVQVVIDALVADEQAEIAAAVAAGTLTQAQADQKLATLVERITDRVDGAGLGRTGVGPRGHGHGPAGDPDQAPAAEATPTAAG